MTSNIFFSFLMFFTYSIIIFEVVYRNSEFKKIYFSSTLFSKKKLYFENYEIQYICSNIIMEYVENKKKVKKKII